MNYIEIFYFLKLLIYVFLFSILTIVSFDNLRLALSGVIHRMFGAISSARSSVLYARPWNQLDNVPLLEIRSELWNIGAPLFCNSIILIKWVYNETDNMYKIHQKMYFRLCETRFSIKFYRWWIWNHCDSYHYWNASRQVAPIIAW